MNYCENIFSITIKNYPAAEEEVKNMRINYQFIRTKIGTFLLRRAGSGTGSGRALKRKMSLPLKRIASSAQPFPIVNG